ncbi:MAG: hypothetical protein LBB72_05360 [Spirochaetaceae bacterium]|nr:hypothetical protein [Spirochaetaceae bacterium]
MKKTILVGLCLVVLASGGFALEKAAGFGILFGKTFSSGQINFSDTYYDPYSGYSTDSWTSDWKMDRTSFGAFGFFGISQYIEFNFGLLYKSIGSITETFEG